MWIVCAIRQEPVDFFLRGKAGGEVFGLETLGKSFQHTSGSIRSMISYPLGWSADDMLLQVLSGSVSGYSGKLFVQIIQIRSVWNLLFTVFF